MPSVLLGLGDYRFSVEAAAFDTLRRQVDYRWAKAERIARSPAMQFIGPGSDTITLTGTVYPLHRGGIGQVDAMRKEAGQGKPLTLVSGRGDVMGRWCVTRIEESLSYLMKDGLPRKQEFTVSIEAYGEDDQVGSDGAVKVAAAPAAKSPISEARAVSAVTPIAQQVAAAGMTTGKAASTVQSTATQIGGLVTGGGGGLAQRVGDTALSAVGIDRGALKSQWKSDPVSAVTLVLSAANSSGLLGHEALGQIVGPSLAADVRQLAAAVRTAEAEGLGGLV